MIIKYSLPLRPPQKFETDSDSVVIGRNPSPGQHVDIELVPDEYVSRLHARLFHKDNEYWVKDLDSANGTWLNGVKLVAETRLMPGDKIQIGWTIFEIEMKPEVSACALGPDTDSPTITRSFIEPMASLLGLDKAPDSPDRVIDLMESLPSVPVKESAEEVVDLMESLPSASVPDSAKAARNLVKKVRKLPPSGSVPDQAFDPPTVILDSITPPKGIAVKTPPDSFGDATRIMESAPPPPEPSPVAECKGTIIDLTDVTARPYAVSGKGTSKEMLTQSWRQLTAFNDLCQMLAGADTLESLVQILVKHLQKAIPNAQRGAVLLPDEQGELLLKAYWPRGEHSVSMTWIKRAYDRREPFLWSAPPENCTDSDMPQSAIFHKVKSAVYVPLLLAEEVLGVMCVDNFYTREAFFATDLELMRAIANQVAMFIRDRVLRKDLQREEELRSHLFRQFSPKIAQRIFAKDKHLRIGGERVNPVTILISDVRGFTALSKKMNPDDVVRMLNEMFDAFVPIIFEHDGVVDKYVGDSVLAVFGSPEKDDQQCAKAVQAALKMQEAVHKLGESRRWRRLPVFEVGIGVHTGEVIHGFIGSSERMEYTVIGDTVNQASRYCDGAGADEVIISKTVHERIYRLVMVQPRTIKTKHPEAEPDLEAFVVTGLKNDGSRS